MILKFLIFAVLLIAIIIIPFKKTQKGKNIIIVMFILFSFSIIIALSLLGYKLYEDPNWFRHYLSFILKGN